jgi:hypothetical protein
MARRATSRGRRGESPSAGLSAEERSSIVSRARRGEKLSRGGFKAIAEKAAKRYGSKEIGTRVAAAVMWRMAKKGQLKRWKRR